MSNDLDQRAIVKPKGEELRTALRWRALGREVYLSERERRLLREWDADPANSQEGGTPAASQRTGAYERG
jgi:hypothetical protein